MSIESFIKENQDPYSHLFFIYNIPRKEVFFSSLPMENFFETAPDWQRSFPFLNDNPSLLLHQGQTQDLEKKWQNCLQLSEKETGNFSYIKLNTNQDPVLFRFDAMGASTPDFNTSDPAIIFAVKKYVGKNNRHYDEKNLDNYRKDYAEFIDIAAHDLDAPLRKVSLLVDRLVQKNPSEDLKEYYSRIQTSLTEMRSLIDNLSTWAGFSSASLNPVPCDLDAILADILKNIRQKQPLKNITTAWEDLPVLYGDKSQYQQLFKQILSNAVMYSRPDEDVRITVNAEPLPSHDRVGYNLDPSTEYTRISIGDDGIGFAPEYAERIFKPFTRLHGKSEYPGTGMGLAICKKIVENHGGLIYAESKQNNGATFTLILPQSH